MGRSPKTPSKARGAKPIDLSGVLPEVLEGARLVVFEGKAVLPASEQVGCSRHALGRLLKRPGVVEAIKALATQGGNPDPKRKMNGTFGGMVADQTDEAVELARKALSLRRAGVHYIEACAELGCSKSAYYRALERGREMAREAAKDEAADFLAWATDEGRAAHMRCLADATAARGAGEFQAAVAAERAASAERERLCKLWGVDAPVQVEANHRVAVDVLGRIAAQVAVQSADLLAIPNGATLTDDG